MNWYLEALKKYAVFNGRARRKEYWYFVLFNTLIVVLLSVIDRLMGYFYNIVGLLSGVYALAVLMPAIAVEIRRFHDINLSGWWMLTRCFLLPGLIFIPIGYMDGQRDLFLIICGLVLIGIGVIEPLVFMLQDSNPGENQYGPNPKVTVESSRVGVTEHHSKIQQQTALDDERIYAIIGKELETGATDKGLWIRLFAECGGDEKQTKVLYIKQRAEQLISAERVRLEQVAQERAAETRTAELVQRKTMELSGVIEQLRLKGYQIKKITSGWKVREPLGGRVKLGSDGALLEYASGQVGAPTELKSQLPRHREVPHSNDGKNLEDISDEIIPLFDDENS